MSAIEEAYGTVEVFAADLEVGDELVCDDDRHHIVETWHEQPSGAITVGVYESYGGQSGKRRYNLTYRPGQPVRIVL